MYNTFRHWLLTGILSGLSAVVVLWIILYQFHLKLLELGTGAAARDGLYGVLSPLFIAVLVLFCFLFFFIITSFPGFMIFLAKKQVLRYINKSVKDETKKEIKKDLRSIERALVREQKKNKKDSREIKKLNKKLSKKKKKRKK